MPKPLALVTRSDAATEAVWKEALSDALPEETILSFRDMSAEQRAEAELAIVANPDPADVAQLPNIQWIHSLWAGVERLVAELGPDAVPIVRLVDPELARVMAEAVLAWTYYLHRDMPAYRTNQQKAEWQGQNKTLQARAGEIIYHREPQCAALAKRVLKWSAVRKIESLAGAVALQLNP